MRIPARTIGLVLALMIANPASAGEQLVVPKYPDLGSPEKATENRPAQKLLPPSRIKTIPLRPDGTVRRPADHIHKNQSQFSSNSYWTVERYISSEASDCFLRSSAHRKHPKDRAHGNVSFLLFPQAGEEQLLPRLKVGYAIDPAAKILLEVDGDRYVMSSKNKDAWVERADDRQKILRVMQRKEKMFVFSRSAGSADILYEFRLKGLSQALEKLAECRAEPDPTKEYR